MTVQIELKINSLPRVCEAVHDLCPGFRGSSIFFLLLLFGLNPFRGSTPAQTLFAHAQINFLNVQFIRSSPKNINNLNESSFLLVGLTGILATSNISASSP